MKIPFSVKDGVVSPNAIIELTNFARHSNNKRYVLEIKEETRSKAQNKYRWGVVIKTIKDTINAHLKRKDLPLASSDDIDLYVKEHALGLVHRIPTKNGELLIKGRLKNKSKKDFEQSMEAIRAWAAENGLEIPLPNEEL